jgi:peptidoglycan/LPS O-acetylase OafA/YrhL
MPSTEARSLPQKRLRSIDALRGIAALGVVVYHAVEQGEKVLPGDAMRYPVRVLQFVSSFGYVGVFLFFVISGFCIHLTWARARANGEERPKIPFVAFWKRRLRRLYPPYIIALALFLCLTAATIGISVTHFFVYDVVLHLLMLHNLDPKTCYSINGVFWTLAIEEQLYLAYFLLLFLRTRFGWGVTITVCLLSRVAWMIFSHLVWAKTGIGVPVPEAAASHWFTWALGAIAVEAMFGLVKLPKWMRNLKLATLIIVVSSAVAYYSPMIPKEMFWHKFSWLLLHPLWGVGFFIVVNRVVLAEDSWVREKRLPWLISIFATLGVFSYSIYLTHELTIMQSWRWTTPGSLQIQNVFLLVLPATIFFAWVYFWFCERPFISRRTMSALETKNEVPRSEVSQVWNPTAEPHISVVPD